MLSFILGLIARATSSYSVSRAATAPVALGRWGIQYDQRIIDRKIVQANEDHCGCCVVETQKKKKTMTQYEKTEEYLVPYVM